MASAPAMVTSPPAPAPARPAASANGSAKRRGSAAVVGPRRPKRPKRQRNVAEASSEQVLRCDVDALLDAQASRPSPAAGPAPSLPDPGTVIDVQVLDLSSTGDGLAMQPGCSTHVFVVPFTVPDDTAIVKVVRHARDAPYSVADLVTVTTPSPLRDDSRIRCRHFAACGGCQLQMLDYAEQLRVKRRIVDKAYRNFFGLPSSLVPAVADTIASPLQYGYRTKLTPHFDGPPGARHHARGKPRPVFASCPDIGFMLKGRRRVLDIEDCPIGTDAVRLGMRRERQRMRREFANYQRGATILLRENTRRRSSAEPEPELEPDAEPGTVRCPGNGFVDFKSCETDPKATTTEYIDNFVFTNPAGSFFQNNNSVLPVFTAYVRDHVVPPPQPAAPAINYLIDAYSGSGLFTIALSSLFRHSTGIDVSADSIASARRNASLNGLADDRCRFIAADAAELFRNVSYPANETVVVLDPPRKGCDADFLAQLTRFAPRRLLYVSCNVHTQARDVGILVRGDRGGGASYRLESLVGFDFFPQTGHVEGIAILNRFDGLHDTDAGREKSSS